uniref:Uncharacterized protein n=1 Tax=Oryza sativa subsp. japonica TaxID=39947 RepID=Q2QWS4_ORYSJ|nr:hypothetical protein LOC_Os12g08380 [Oryza sativa Japonica Group]
MRGRRCNDDDGGGATGRRAGEDERPTEGVVGEDGQGRRRTTPAGFGWKGGEAEGDLAAAMPKVMATTAGARARWKGLPEGLRRGGWRSRRGNDGWWLPGKTEECPRWRMALLCRERRRRREPTHRRGGTGGWGGTVAATPLDVDEDTVPASFGRGDGKVGEGGGVAELREVVETSAGAQARRHRRLEVVQWRQHHCLPARMRLR